MRKEIVTVIAARVPSKKIAKAKKSAKKHSETKIFKGIEKVIKANRRQNIIDTKTKESVMKEEKKAFKVTKTAAPKAAAVVPKKIVKKSKDLHKATVQPELGFPSTSAGWAKWQKKQDDSLNEHSKLV